MTGTASQNGDQISINFTTSCNLTSNQPSTPTPAQPTPPTSNPSGTCSVSSPSANLDYADCNGVGGWALDQNNLNQPVTIDIYVDGAKTYSGITASGDRQDLVGAFGNQAARYHGFSYQFPADASWKNGQNHNITVRICGVGNDINGSPRTVNCSGGNPNSTPTPGQPTTPTSNSSSGGSGSLNFQIVSYDCNSGQLQYQFTSSNGSPVNVTLPGIFGGTMNPNTVVSYTFPGDARQGRTITGTASQGGNQISINFTTSCNLASSQPTDFGNNYSAPTLVQYNPSLDDDADPVSAIGPGYTSAGGTVGNILPSNLTIYSTELQRAFPRGLSINVYSEAELQIMANTILADLGLTNINQLEQPPFLPILFLDGLNKMIQVSREALIVKQLNPTWSANRCLAQAYMNYCLRTVHIVLDVAGLVPGAGELPDAINGGIYLLEGDKTNAGLSFAATIPIAGWAATGGKYAKQGLQALGDSKFISAEGLIWASRTYRDDKESLHALNHVYLHFKEIEKKNYHGIFTIRTDELIGLIDAAWAKVKSGTPGIVRIVGDNGNISYSVPMWPIGVSSGKKAVKGQVLTRVNIIIDGSNPNHIVTAFPE